MDLSKSLDLDRSIAANRGVSQKLKHRMTHSADPDETVTSYLIWICTLNKGLQLGKF